MGITYKLKKIYDAKIVCKKLNKKRTDRNESEKKILLIGHNSDKQGAAVLLEYIAKECVKQGWHTEILVRNPGEMIARYTEVCNTVCFLGKKDFERVIKKYSKRGFKNAICNTTVSGDLVPILKKYGYKVEVLIHELPNAIQSLKIEKRAAKIAELSDRVVFPSSFVHKKFLQFGEIENYLIRPQGLYLTANHTVDYKQSLKELDKELDIKNRKIVINVATGELRKGFDLFLQIANKLRKEKEILFIWIGSVNEKIYQDVLKGEKPDNLVLYGYVNDASHLAKFYDCADVLLLTSREEPFGSIVLEAFHAGTPVIGFENAGGFVDTVLPGKTGELVEYESVDKMAVSLVKLLKDDNALREYSRNCVELSKNYKFDKYVEIIMEIFDER